ncbi:MAG: oligosaccharide flippase family protein [Chthonomonadales bacterium]
MSKAVILSTLLRLASMGSKFILILFFAKLLKPAELGMYGLMAQTVNTCVMIAGMQFFLYSTREIAGADPEKQPAMVRDQAIYHSILYLIVLPLFLIVFIRDMLPWYLIGWFYLLVVVEHMSYELQRILVVFGKPVASNAIHLLRTGAWIYVTVPLMLVVSRLRHIDTVWLIWFTGSGSSVLVAIWMMRNRGWRKAWKQPIDWGWIKSGIRVAFHYIPGTIVLMLTALFDVYTLKAYAGKAVVGVYVFYATIANIVVAFPEAGVATVMMPKILREYAAGRMDGFNSMMKDFWKRLVLSVIVTSVFAGIAMMLALKFLDKGPVYRESLTAFWMLLFSTSMTSLSLWPHHHLYTRHHDKPLVMVSVLAIIPYVIMILLLVPRYGIIGAAISCVVLQTCNLLFKFALVRLIKDDPHKTHPEEGVLEVETIPSELENRWEES